MESSKESVGLEEVEFRAALSKLSQDYIPSLGLAVGAAVVDGKNVVVLSYVHRNEGDAKKHEATLRKTIAEGSSFTSGRDWRTVFTKVKTTVRGPNLVAVLTTENSRVGFQALLTHDHLI